MIPLWLTLVLICLAWAALLALMLVFFTGASRDFSFHPRREPGRDLSNPFHGRNVMRRRILRS